MVLSAFGLESMTRSKTVVLSSPWVMGHAVVRFSLSTPNVNLDRCKLHCIAVPGCRGLDFGPEGCRIWLSEVAINSVNMTSDLEAECFSYEPFRDVDGGMGRDCRGHDGSDLDSSYFMQFPAASLQACQDLCVQQGRRRCSRKAMQGNCIRLNRRVMPSLGSFSGHWCNSGIEQCCMSEI